MGYLSGAEARFRWVQVEWVLSKNFFTQGKDSTMDLEPFPKSVDI